MSGAASYYGGLAAEESVARRYQNTGHEVAARRWRSRAGEIDLIVRKDGNIIFVEVKKSRSLEKAAYRLGARQIERIYQSAAVFLDREPQGQNSNARFDVALVDGMGRIEVLENALCA